MFPINFNDKLTQNDDSDYIDVIRLTTLIIPVQRNV